MTQFLESPMESRIVHLTSNDEEMNMSKHTPGPWDTSSGQVYVKTANGDCTLLANNVGSNQYANARLMAAAPDLADALKPFAKLFLYPDDIEGHDDEEARGDDGIEELYVSRKAIRAARAALAKAGL